MKVSIYWVTNDWMLIRRIREKYRLPQRMTLNGVTEAEVDEETLKALRKGEPEYLKIRKCNDYDESKENINTKSSPERSDR